MQHLFLFLLFLFSSCASEEGVYKSYIISKSENEPIIEVQEQP